MKTGLSGTLQSWRVKAFFESGSFDEEMRVSRFFSG